MRQNNTDRCAVSRTALMVLAVLATAACAPLPNRETRLARSSLGCMNAALREHLPERQGQKTDDAQLHCAAAGLIARYCSVTEATIASYGKELKDLFGAGDAQWRDLGSDRRGIRCARSAPDTVELLKCCGLQAEGYID